MCQCLLIFRTATARGKAEQADMAADHAREDSDIAIATAKQFAPDFKQPGLEKLKIREPYRVKTVPEEHIPVKTIPHSQQNDISSQIPNQVPTHNPSVNLPSKPQQNQNQSLYAKKAEINQINQLSNQIPPNPTLTNPNPEKMDHIDQNQNHQEPKSPPNNLRRSNQSLNRIPNNPEPQSNPTNPNPSRRSSKMMNEKPRLGEIQQQLSIDHFDHYKRPPSRDPSVDRYTRAASRLGLGSRQSSVDKTSIDQQVQQDVRSVRAPSVQRGTTPAPTGNGNVLTGSAANG